MDVPHPEAADLRRTLPAAPRPPDAFAHCVLRTSRYDALIDWYCTVLQARVAHRNDRLCFLTYDEEHHRLAIINVPGLPEQETETARLVHIAYSYADLAGLLGTYSRLKAAGILPYRPINHGPTLSLYYRDPDGTAVELQVDCYPSKAEAAAFLDSEAFRRNPIGVAIDPDAILAAWEAGVPEATLLRRPEGPALASQG
jgi:catechol 2,3-dioxygenase-like lactoylglutathione lyase family enzyme